MNLTQTEVLISLIPNSRPGLFNPYRDECPHQTQDNSSAARAQRLAAHLDRQAKYILCGEAPGYQGCRYSGIAFTSERLLLEGSIPGVPSIPGRLSNRRLPFSEPSATTVWKNLYALRIEESTIMWNALQMHPYPANGETQFWGNRTPSEAEFQDGIPALQFLIENNPDAHLIAVGGKAAGLLKRMGIPPAACVRHPAFGGATEFSAGLSSFVRSL